MILTPEQQLAQDRILTWFSSNKNQFSLLTLGGYAGTGKTTLISSMREQLGDQISVSYLAFTGKAVSVIKRKVQKILSKSDSISTIHSFMYRPIIENHKIIGWDWKQMQDEDDSEINPKYFAPYTDLIVIDEASMVPRELFDDLQKYDKPILAVGDHGQLPPIKSDFNLMENPEIKLEKILRQAEDSMILKLAHLAREGNYIKMGEYSTKVSKISVNKLSGSFIEKLVSTPSSDTMVIVAKNDLRVSLNKQIRKHALNRFHEPPDKGDRIICLQNDWRAGIYNGMTGEVRELLEEDQYNYQIKFKPDSEDDSKEPLVLLVLQCLFNSEKKIISPLIPFKLRGNQFDFSYAITCHKAQGSEAKNVIVFGEGFGTPEDRNRWMYTAITRAQEQLHLVAI